jgi:hypothetical protein
MKPPTKPGYYWYKEENKFELDRWTIVEVVYGGIVYFIGSEIDFLLLELKGEWGEKVERKQS